MPAHGEIQSPRTHCSNLCALVEHYRETVNLLLDELRDETKSYCTADCIYGRTNNKCRLKQTHIDHDGRCMYYQKAPKDFHFIRQDVENNA